MADYIAKRNDWDAAILELGINLRTDSQEKFASLVDDFIPTPPGIQGLPKSAAKMGK